LDVRALAHAIEEHLRRVEGLEGQLRAPRLVAAERAVDVLAAQEELHASVEAVGVVLELGGVEEGEQRLRRAVADGPAVASVGEAEAPRRVEPIGRAVALEGSIDLLGGEEADGIR